MDTKKNTLLFWITIGVLSILKILLIRNQDYFVGGDLIHDDQLFVKLAQYLVNFEWLGPFNNLTLAKDPGYPLWLAFSYFLNIPAFFSQHLLYIGACLTAVFSVKPIVENSKLLSVLFGVLLFNPISFSTLTTRAAQENIYPSLALLTLACCIGLFLRIKEHKKTYSWLWSLGAGLSLSCFWITRSEGVWLIPCIVGISMVALYTMWRQRSLLSVKTALIAIPFLCLLAVNLLIGKINFDHYGVFGVTEFAREEFVSAYGALTRIQSDQWRQYVPVSHQQLAEGYKVSPALAELQPYLEGDLGDGWEKVSIQNSQHSTPGEIAGGWFMWAFRDAAAQAGYYESGTKALQFYSRLASEINTACESGEIKCLAKRSTMVPPLSMNNILPLAASSVKGARFVIGFDQFSLINKESRGDPPTRALFAKFMQPNLDQRNGSTETTILKAIGKLYQVVAPWIFILAGLCALGLIVKVRTDDAVLILYALFIAIVARIGLLAIIDSTSFPAINVRYFSSLYPLMIFASFLSLCSFFKHYIFPSYTRPKL